MFDVGYRSPIANGAEHMLRVVYKIRKLSRQTMCVTMR